VGQYGHAFVGITEGRQSYYKWWAKKKGFALCHHRQCAYLFWPFGASGQRARKLLQMAWDKKQGQIFGVLAGEESVPAWHGERPSAEKSFGGQTSLFAPRPQSPPTISSLPPQTTMSDFNGNWMPEDAWSPKCTGSAFGEGVGPPGPPMWRYPMPLGHIPRSPRAVYGNNHPVAIQPRYSMPLTPRSPGRGPGAVAAIKPRVVAIQPRQQTHLTMAGVSKSSFRPISNPPTEKTSMVWHSGAANKPKPERRVPRVVHIAAARPTDTGGVITPRGSPSFVETSTTLEKAGYAEHQPSVTETPAPPTDESINHTSGGTPSSTPNDASIVGDGNRPSNPLTLTLLECSPVHHGRARLDEATQPSSTSKPGNDASIVGDGNRPANAIATPKPQLPDTERMALSDMFQELKSYGVSTSKMFERQDLVKALTNARAIRLSPVFTIGTYDATEEPDDDGSYTSTLQAAAFEFDFYPK
jgi:hypothetical protein